jgi:hypothetical protein
MALLNTNTSLVWFGDATSKCEQIDILNFRDEITSVYYVEDSNTNLLASKKSSLATISTRYRYLDAGAGGLIFVSDTSLVLDDVVKSYLNEDAGRIIPTYIERFETSGTIPGTFVMTSEFKNKKPVYKNTDYQWYIWYDESESVWIASEDAVSKDKTFLKGDTCLPNFQNYTNDSFSSHLITTQNWDCLEVDELNGVVESANGIYCQTATYNEHPAYVSCNGAWYIYFDLITWVLTDSPYNREGMWLINGSTSVYTKFNNVAGGNGSSSFNNQTAVVKSMGIPAGALMVEDGEDILFTENDNTAVTGEGT